MKYPKYPAYKDSGVEWLEEVPTHWDVPLLKYVARLKYGDSLAADSRDDSGNVPVFGSNGTVGFHSSANTKAPAIIVGRKGSYGKLTFSPEVAFSIDTTYFIDSTCTDHNLRWLYYALQPAGLDKNSQDTGVPGLSREAAYSTRFIAPPLAEQHKIAAFLDHETAQIDTLIAKQERLIALLQEKRQALISHAVTKGLNPDAPMKDSGVGWLGEIPEHWKRAPLKRLVCQKITDGPHETPEFLDSGYPFLSAEAVKNNALDFDKKRGCIDSKTFERYSQKCLPRRNDIFMVKSGNTTGALAMVETDDAFAIWSPLALIRTKSDVDPRFAFYCMNSIFFQRSVSLFSSYGTQPNIGMGVIENLVLTVPPLDEQFVIVSYLDHQLENIDILTSKATEAIEKLQERRSALISSAVTGKIDVRGYVNETKL